MPRRHRARAGLHGTDVLALGETMAVVTPVEPGPLGPDTRYTIRAGGAESNVAAHLARMGHRASWAGYVGADPFGDLVTDELRGAGVGVEHVEVVQGVPTGIYVKHVEHGSTGVYYYRRGSAAARMAPDFLRRLDRLRPRVLHLTGITPALSDGCLALCRVALGGGAGAELTSFDVNYRPALWAPGHAAQVLHALAAGADIVFVGLDEAAGLWGTSTPQEVRALLPRPAVLVVKDGAVGATAFDRHGNHHVPAPPVDVVEVVGAGDAFAAGWLSGLLQGADPATRLALGHRVAGHVLGTTADDAALPPELTARAHTGR